MKRLEDGLTCMWGSMYGKPRTLMVCTSGWSSELLQKRINHLGKMLLSRIKVREPLASAI
jgi:hypothetical protein